MTWIVNVVVTTALFWTLSQSFASSSSRLPTSEPLRRISRAVEPLDYHLPDNVLPNSYEIKIVPDMDGEYFTFRGETKINISVKKPTKEITLHATYLNISDSIQLQCHLNENQSEIFIFNISGQSTNNMTDILTINLAEELSVGSECNLTLHFASTTESRTDGLGFFETFPSSGTKPRLVVTNFEPIYARRAFPCWDKPALKANFIISIEHDKKYVALSNMHVEREETDPANESRVITHFAKSPNMSTYMVAFAIGDLAKTMKNDSGNFNVWTRKELSNRATYVQKIGPRILNLLEKYTNFTYEAQGFEKMDFLAVPYIENGDGIENWGLITGLESKVLVPEENSTASFDEKYLVMIVAHELAHQWFSNLVSPSSWEYLWLNQGFDLFFSHLIGDQAEPSWRIKDWFVTVVLQSHAFLYDDTIDGIPALNKKSYNSDDFVENALNPKINVRAACLIRMISHVVGEKKFQDRIRHYIKSHAFKSATSDDLLTELAGDDEELLGFMKNWVSLQGYPLVKVTRNYEKETATITQTRYLKNNGTSTEKYWIPLNYVTEDNLNFNDTKVTHWLRPTENSTEITHLNKDKFVIFNKQQFGYYRVNYDEKNWELIAEYLCTKNYSKIHAVNRAQLIDDAFNLARSGQLKYNVLLNLIKYLEKETDLMVWSRVWSPILILERYLGNSEFAKPFQNYYRNLTRNIFKKINLNQDDPMMRAYKDDLLLRACQLGSDLCPTKRAQEAFTKWLEELEKNPYVADPPEWILCSIGRADDQEKLDKIWEIHSHKDKHMIFTSIGCSNNITFQKELLSKAAHNMEKGFDFLRFKDEFVNTVSEEGINVYLEFLFQHYKPSGFRSTPSHLATYSRYPYGMRFVKALFFSGVWNWVVKYSLYFALENLNQRYQLIEILQFIEDNETSVGDALDEITQKVWKNVENFEKRSNEFRTFFGEDSTVMPTSTNTPNIGEKTIDLNIILLISILLLLI